MILNSPNDNPPKNVIIQEAKSLLFIIFIALVIRTLILEPFFIPSSSLKATLLEGDYVFATKYDYGYSKHSFLLLTPHFIKGRILATNPQSGDIIIFRSDHNMDMRYIKRLIGLPGDKVQMISGIIYINDKPVQREYLGKFTDEDGRAYKRYLETLPNGRKYYSLYIPDEEKHSINYSDNTKAFYVPEGHYFFMGDNRNDSNDSRADLGFIPFENIIAKAQFIFFSTKEKLWLGNSDFTTQVKQIYKWISSTRVKRLFKSIYSLESYGE